MIDKDKKWKKVKVGDVIEFNPRESLKKGTVGKYVEMANLECYVKNILGYELKEYKGGTKFRNGDTILARITPCLENGKTAFIDFLDKEEIGFGSTEYIVLREKSGITDNQFIYYLSISDEFRDLAIKSMSGTSGRQRVQNDVLKSNEIYLPSLEIQKKIAKVLSVLDEKIRINNEINNNLIKLAMMFFDLFFKNKKINGCLGDYCHIKSGFAFKSSWWQKTGIKVVKISSITQDKLNLSLCSHVSSDKISLAPEFLLQKGDLVIAMTGATLGKFAIIPETKGSILTNQRVGKFFLGDYPLEKLPFIYCQLKQNDIYKEIINRGQGSAQPNISANDLMTIPCYIPPKEEIDKFNAIAKPLFCLFTKNQYTSEYLNEIRNIVLPKLLSGEIDISNIELGELL